MKPENKYVCESGSKWGGGYKNVKRKLMNYTLIDADHGGTAPLSRGITKGIHNHARQPVKILAEL